MSVDRSDARLPGGPLALQRLRRRVLVLSGLLLCAVLVAVQLVLARRVRFVPEEAPALEEVREELTRSQGALIEAMDRAGQTAAALVETSRRQQQEVSALQARYDALKALADGQEQVAESHRAILSRRTPYERLTDNITGFVVGVLSSIAASVLLSFRAPRRR